MSSVLLDWKIEPVSPLNEEVNWLQEDNFYQTLEEDIKLENDLVPCKSKVKVASQILEDLENLVDLDELIKEEPYLLDEKILPILEEVNQPCSIEVPQNSLKLEYIRSHDTQFLLKEFENVYDVIGHTLETLTPPQSPPNQPTILTTLEPLLTQSTYTILPDKQHGIQSYPVPEKQISPNLLAYQPDYASNISMEFSPQPDLAHELAVVDELVRARVENMQWENGPSSPNSNSSGSSNFGDCSSDDPEWVPEAVENYDNPASPPKNLRKRTKPYSRNGSVDKKSRKKEQNKNAATRYRMKKKAEVEVILTEEKGLMQHNDDLSAKINDLQREIKYLKGLMRDLFKAKGLIN